MVATARPMRNERVSGSSVVATLRLPRMDVRGTRMDKQGNRGRRDGVGATLGAVEMVEARKGRRCRVTMKGEGKGRRKGQNHPR